MINPEDQRFGSARWATEDDIKQAKLYRRPGMQFGFFEKKPLFLDGDAPWITFGGAGSGKLRDLLGYIV